MSRSILIGYILFSFAAVLQLLATILPYWKTNDPSGAVIEWREVNIGLWHKCTGYSTGIFSCDDFDSIWLGQQSEITTARVTMCVAQLLNLIIFVLFQMSAPWTTCLDEDLQPRLMSWAGGCTILSNILVAIGSGYYGSKVLTDYATLTGLYHRDQQFTNFGSGSSVNFNGQTMIFGGSLYSAWISVLFGLASGIMVLCGVCNDTEDEDEEYYNPSGIQTMQMQNSIMGRQSSIPHEYVNKAYNEQMRGPVRQPYV